MARVFKVNAQLEHGDMYRVTVTDERGAVWHDDNTNADGLDRMIRELKKDFEII